MQSLTSRPLAKLGCPALHFLTAFLLSDTDLIGLGSWDAELRQGLTPTAWCRSHLHVAVQCHEGVAREMTDLLDLRYLDQVAFVRASDLVTLDTEAADAIADSRRSQGLIWALLTDPRDGVHGLGMRLMTEVYVRAIRAFGAG